MTPVSSRRASRSDRPAILLVEDDAPFRAMMTALLTDAGYDVAGAADHRAALAVIEAGQRLDLLVTDVVMPRGVSGFTLARMVRLRRPKLKILYMTGYDIPASVRPTIGPILRKPVGREPLIAAIRGLVH
jgi:CheY-like chemotaxis protein